MAAGSASSAASPAAGAGGAAAAAKLRHDSIITTNGSSSSSSTTTSTPPPSHQPSPSPLLSLPRELRDLIWEASLLAELAPSPPSPGSSADDCYRAYESWGEEALRYPRRTRVNAAALLCVSRGVQDEVREAVRRLRAQRRLRAVLRCQLRGERVLLLDWLCVPCVAAHYDEVEVVVKMVGCLRKDGEGRGRTNRAPTGESSGSGSGGGGGGGGQLVGGDAFSRAFDRTREAERLNGGGVGRDERNSSILVSKMDADFKLYRHLFKMLARLRSYGPSLAGDPVIYSAVSTPSGVSSHAALRSSSNSASSSKPPSQSNSLFSSSASSSSSSSLPPRPYCRPGPTTFGNLVINVISPPPHLNPPPNAVATPWWPWESPRGRPHSATRAIALRREQQRLEDQQRLQPQLQRRHQHLNQQSPSGTFVPPECVYVHLREFVVWALHRRENAFLTGGFGSVAVLLDGRELGVGDVVKRVEEDAAARPTAAAMPMRPRNLHNPCLPPKYWTCSDGSEGNEERAGQGQGERSEGEKRRDGALLLHRYCLQTWEVRRALMQSLRDL